MKFLQVLKSSEVKPQESSPQRFPVFHNSLQEVNYGHIAKRQIDGRAPVSGEESMYGVRIPKVLRTDDLLVVVRCIQNRVAVAGPDRMRRHRARMPPPRTPRPTPRLAESPPAASRATLRAGFLTCGNGIGLFGGRGAASAADCRDRHSSINTRHRSGAS